MFKEKCCCTTSSQYNFSDANENREISFFTIQLIINKIGNHSTVVSQSAKRDDPYIFRDYNVIHYL